MKPRLPAIFFFISVLVMLKVTAGSAPKLVIFLVYDQFRSDILTVNKPRFLPSRTGNQLGGFNYLMENSSYFPFAEYEIFSSMTCPGHAIISTGSWPIHTGIAINDWYSRTKNKREYCVDDDEFGISPRKLKTTTISDEYKGSDLPSKVFAIALKDRSSVMLGGHRADAALWFDEKKWLWASSKYYSNNSLTWINDHNRKLSPKKPDPNLLRQIWGSQVTFDLAEEVLTKEKLGQGKGTDFLFISFSAHDKAGHVYGPNSDEMKKMNLDEDRELSKFLNFLKKKFNLERDIAIVLTGDHGIPPGPEYSAKNKINSEYIDEIQLIEKVYKKLNSTYSSSEKNEWFKAIETMHYHVNWDLVSKLKINRREFLEKVRAIVKEFDIAEEVIAPELYSKNDLISPRLKRQIENSFIEDQWGDIVLMPKPYSFPFEKGRKADHVSGYSYDKMVPLLLFGSGFKKQTFYSKAYIVDIHPTIAAILGVVPGPKVDGRILHEAIK